MLSIIGIFPATYALNPQHGPLSDLAATVQQAEPFVSRYGDDEKTQALGAARSIRDLAMADAGAGAGAGAVGGTGAGSGTGTAGASVAAKRASLRDDVYQVISELKHAEEAKGISADDKRTVKDLTTRLGQAVEYAPTWVRLLSAVCLGVGTMIGYRRIVTTLGERLGNQHLTPAQGASAEVVSALLIGTAGFSGLPVSTTHIVTSGIAGTMVSSGAGLRYGMISRIVMAWVFTLPVTMAVACGLYYFLASPRF
jgi:PiT family inorganic phosphate transporter